MYRESACDPLTGLLFCVIRTMRTYQTVPELRGAIWQRPDWAFTVPSGPQELSHAPFWVYCRQRSPRVARGARESFRSRFFDEPIARPVDSGNGLSASCAAPVCDTYSCMQGWGHRK